MGDIGFGVKAGNEWQLRIQKESGTSSYDPVRTEGIVTQGDEVVPMSV